MTTKNSTLICFLILVATIANGQSRIRPYLGLSSFNVVYAGINKTVSINKTIGIEAGYIVPLKKQAYYNGLAAPFRSLNETGFQISPYFEIAHDENFEKVFSFKLEYANLKSNNFIYDEYQDFARHLEGYTSYSEFKEVKNNYAFLVSYAKEIDWDNMFYAYFSVGFKISDVKRTYSIEGTDTNKYPSDRKERLVQYAPVFNIGMKFYLTK
jgi:hypothetical protein